MWFPDFDDELFSVHSSKTFAISLEILDRIKQKLETREVLLFLKLNRNFREFLCKNGPFPRKIYKLKIEIEKEQFKIKTSKNERNCRLSFKKFSLFKLLEGVEKMTLKSVDSRFQLKDLLPKLKIIGSLLFRGLVHPRLLLPFFEGSPVQIKEEVDFPFKKETGNDFFQAHLSNCGLIRNWNKLIVLEELFKKNAKFLVFGMEDNVEDLWILLDEGIPSRYPLAGCYLEISQKDDKRGLTKVLAKNRDLIRIYDQEILSPIFDSILLTPSINKEKLKGIEKFFRSSQFQCFKKRVDSKSELLFLFVEEKKRIHLYAKCQLADSPFLAERILPFLEFPSVIKTLIYQKLSTISRFRLLKANHQLRNIILTNGAFPKIVWSLRIDRGQEIRIQSTADSRPYEFQSEENFIDLCRAIQGVDSLTVADWDAQLLPLRELFPNLRHIKYFICPKESSFPNLANFFNESKADVFGETDLRFKREPGALEFEKNPFKDCCRIRVDGVIGILEFLRGIKVEVLEVSPRQKDQLEEMRFLIDHGIPSAHPCSYLQLYGSKMNTVNGGELIELCKEQKNIILSVDLSDKLLDSFKSFTEIFTGIDPRDLPIVFSFSKCFNPKICHYLLVAVNEYIYLLMQQSNE